MSLRRTVLLSLGFIGLASCSDESPVQPSQRAAPPPESRAQSTPIHVAIGKNARLRTAITVAVSAKGFKATNRTSFNRTVDIVFPGAKGHRSTAVSSSALPSDPSQPAGSTTPPKRAGRQAKLAEICADLMVVRETAVARILAPAESASMAVAVPHSSPTDVMKFDDIGGKGTPPTRHRTSRGGKVLHAMDWKWARVSGGWIASDLTIADPNGFTIHCSLDVKDAAVNVADFSTKHIGPTLSAAAKLAANRSLRRAHDAERALALTPASPAAGSTAVSGAPLGSSALEDDATIDDGQAAEDASVSSAEVNQFDAIDAADRDALPSASEAPPALPPVGDSEELTCSMPKCWSQWLALQAARAELVAAEAEMIDICADPVTWELCEFAESVVTSCEDSVAAAQLIYDSCMGYW